MNFSNIWPTVVLGFKNLLLHKLRSALTILGIIFGVCSVITMLAVGEGASQQSQERIKHLGRDNIIVESVKPPVKEGETRGMEVLKYGVTRLDVERIRETVRGVKDVVPQRILSEPVKYGEKSKTAEVIGTLANYKTAVGVNVDKGRFLCEMDDSEQRNVCVVSRKLADTLFSFHDPLDCSIKVKGVYYQVVGVVSEGGEDDEKSSKFTAYLPLSTMIARYGELYIKRASGTMTAEQVQLHKVIIQMKNGDAVLTGQSQIRQLLDYTRKEKDYQMVVPLQLLKEAEETKRMFNIVLGSIAAISLIVGGIGVMNIMLATVTERTREIGLRRALGAKKKDIVSQFMVESVLLSLCGGFIGVLLGMILPNIISTFTDMPVVVTPVSVIVAFGVSAVIGLVFGIYPAAKSAQLDPIEALRNE